MPLTAKSKYGTPIEGMTAVPCGVPKHLIGLWYSIPSPKLREYFYLLGSGHTSFSIADSHGLSPHTTKWNIDELTRLLGLSCTAALRLLALRVFAEEQQPPRYPNLLRNLWASTRFRKAGVTRVTIDREVRDIIETERKLYRASEERFHNRGPKG